MEHGRSKEDYLEAILMTELEKGEVRSVDVAEALGFSKASVSRAVAQLTAEHLVLFGEDKRIRLTPAGRRLAEQVYEKHSFFKRMLEGAGVEPALAAKEACAIEHTISDETFAKVKRAYRKNHGQGEKRASGEG